MAEGQPMQPLAFHFGSKTPAFLGLTRGMNRSRSVFNSTLPEFLDPLVKAEKCAKDFYVIGIAASTVN